MKTEDQYHQQLIKEIAKEYEEILNSSQQAIYIWLDEECMVCNSRFVDLLGYHSAAELSSKKGSFLQAFVAERSQETLAKAYNDAMSKKISSTFPLTWKKKNGETIPSQVNLVPIIYDNHLFALHFID
jgi:PAS domain S-box-containing protein